MNNAYVSSEEALAIDNLMPGAQLFGIGSKLKTALDAQVFVGTKWYLDPVNGLDTNDGLSVQTAFKTLPVAYAALTANKNEVLYLVGGASSINITTGFVWAKAYTHLVGLSAGGVYGRSRIGHSTYVAAIEDLFTVSGAGCIFKNIHWQQGNGHAGQLNCVVVTSSYNTFDNCHFDGPLNAVEGALAYSCLEVAANAQSNKFFHCTFGDWSSSNSATDGCLVRFLGKSAGTEFESCVFLITTDEASMVAIIAAVDVGGGDTGGYIRFSDCEFLALETALTVLATAPTAGKLIFSKCRACGITNWSANSTNVFSLNGPAFIADGGLGVVIS